MSKRSHLSQLMNSLARLSLMISVLCQYGSLLAQESPWHKNYGSGGSDIILSAVNNEAGGINSIIETTSVGAEQKKEYYLVKFDQGGNALWKTAISIPNCKYQPSSWLSIDNKGSSYISIACGVKLREYPNLLVEIDKLFKYDRNGNLKWESTFEVDKDEDSDLFMMNSSLSYLPDEIFVPLKGGGSCAAFTFETLNHKSNDVLIAKFGASGSTLWKTLIDSDMALIEKYGSDVISEGTCADEFFDLFENSRSEIFITSAVHPSFYLTKDKGPTKDFITLTKLSSNGNVQWQKEISFADRCIAPEAVLPGASGEIYILARSDESQRIEFGSDFTPVLLKISETGELLWRRDIEVLKSADASFSLIELTDGTIFINANDGGTKFGYGNISPDGKLLGSGVFDDIFLTQVIESTEGNFLGIGSKDERGYFLEFDLQGNIVRQNSYGEPNRNILRGIYADSKKRILTYGLTEVIKDVQVDLQFREITLSEGLEDHIPKLKNSNPNAVAVLIGNKNYSKVDPVSYAINDIRTMRKYLINTLGFEGSNIIYLEDATLTDFLTVFGTSDNPKGALYNSLIPNKSDVFVFYSGHGAPGTNDHDPYFVPIHCDPKYVELTGYPVKEFYSNLSQLPAKEILILTDACFSGINLESLSPISVKVNEQKAWLENGAVLNSSTFEQYSSWYDEEEHGLFSWAFLNALKDYKTTDANSDRKVTLQEVYDRISSSAEGIPYLARKFHGIEQTPMIQGELNDKILFQY